MGRQLPFGPGDVSTRLRPITGRHSLLPASYSRTSNNVPYGFACSDTLERKYGVSTFHVFDDYVDDLGPFCTPAALCPRRSGIPGTVYKTTGHLIYCPRNSRSGATAWLTSFFCEGCLFRVTRSTRSLLLEKINQKTAKPDRHQE
jgi:hypothetical protein